jgi:hypothetical protein
MIRSNFERWLRVPQLAIGYPTQLRHAALARPACRRPARLALLVGGAAFCAALAMPAASARADARPSPVSVGASSTEPGRLSGDELSGRRHGAGSRRHGGGGYGRTARSGHKSAHHKAHKSAHRKPSPWAAAAKKNRKELARLDKAMNRKSAVQKKRTERETNPWAASAERNRKELARRDKAMGSARHEGPSPPPSPSPGPPPTPPR